MLQPIEGKEGLFAIEDSMPCNPAAIKIPPYFLPSTLGRFEREEAAARILAFSQQVDQWVGVNWPEITKMMQADYELYHEIQAVREHNSREENQPKGTVLYYTLCVLTLGIYTFFASKPTVQLKEEPTEKPPFSGIYTMGPNCVAIGIHELVDNGMLKRVTEGEDEEALSVFFPTPALITRIMQAQRIPTTA